jgi:hypothetical protein
MSTKIVARYFLQLDCTTIEYPVVRWTFASSRRLTASVFAGGRVPGAVDPWPRQVGGVARRVLAVAWHMPIGPRSASLPSTFGNVRNADRWKPETLRTRRDLGIVRLSCARTLWRIARARLVIPWVAPRAHPRIHGISCSVVSPHHPFVVRRSDRRVHYDTNAEAI